MSASGMSGGPYCYYYDGNGLRVAKAHGASCTSAPPIDVLYWRSVGGDTIAETDSGGSTSNSSYHEYVFFAGRRIARSDVSSGNVYFLFADHLGSTRAMTQANGTVCFVSEYYPYGQELNTTSSCSTNYKFTGYERDAETGVDYAFARYYNARLGRFMSGDPLGGDISDPQTLNRYTYVRNNPVNLTDPSGLLPSMPDSSWWFPPDCGDCGQFDWLSGGGGGHGSTARRIWDAALTEYLARIPWYNVIGGHLWLVGPPNWRFVPNPNWDPNNPDSSAGSFSGTASLHDLGTLTEAIYGGGDNSNWWGTAVNTFFTVPYRKPGEGFTACWNRAASDTLVGMGVPREATPGTEALLGSAGTVGLFSSVKSIWALGNWVRPSSYLAKAMGAGAAGVRAARFFGRAMATSFAAEAGIRAGAALDCAIPVK